MYQLTIFLLCGLAVVYAVTDCNDKSPYCTSYFPSSHYCTPAFKNYWTMMKVCPKYCSICTDQCGMSQSANGRVIGGRDTNAASWPWNAAIFFKGKFICGGVLINSEFVMTSAACLKDRASKDILVHLGETDLTKVEGEQRFRAYKITLHPHYVGGKKYGNSLGLIELHIHARFTKTVQPACLPAMKADPTVGSVCYLTGWGKKQAVGGPFNNAYHILQQAPLRITSNKACHAKNLKGHPITDGMLCGARTSSSGHQGACINDFGSPLVCKQSNGSWMVHGIVEWIHIACNTDVYDTVFTRVSSYRSWIEQIAKV